MLQSRNPKNEKIKIWVNGLVDRKDAKVSVFDSVVQGGDAVWEGLRVYEEGVFLLDRHLDRLLESAHALQFEAMPSREQIIHALSETLNANGMNTDTHIRLTLTRGEKITSGMDPRLNDGYTLIVLAEWKPPVYDNTNGIKVITSSIRRNNPAFLDSKIHHNNLLNNILAKIQSNAAGMDAGLMLDKDGFIAELNGSNVFMIKNGIVYTPYADACLPGITRGIVIEICDNHLVPIIEKNISLTELYNADLAFATGTMGELTPIREVDGRSIDMHTGRNLFKELGLAFEALREEYCIKI